ncbi:MAG: fatty acyl-AMP ligase [Planctomycetaceae bacterium]|nr:fatty acyl-AMP ligase [Planctomycetaceae bacterium]
MLLAASAPVAGAHSPAVGLAMNPPADAAEPPLASVAELLRRRARELGSRPAFTFTDEAGAETQSSYAQLDARAAAVGHELAAQLAPGDRAALVFPPGLDFIAAFFGCLYAGVVPVPATFPKPRRPSPRLDAIVADSDAAAVLTTAATLETVQLDQQSPAVQAARWIAVDQLATTRPALVHPARHDDLCFLQYTSGSTSDPRGVMISHGNLLANLETIRGGFGLEIAGADDTCPAGVFWLPAYHDMGLIGGILTPLYVGGTSHLLSPAAFLKRPLAWLEKLSATRSAISGAPNFAYQLCADKTTAEQAAALDLSNWQLAFCGAEPIDPAALDNFAKALASSGFRREAFYPCYGLAEATLLVSGGHAAGEAALLNVDRAEIAAGRAVPAANGTPAKSLVNCGCPLGGVDVAIVDPATNEQVPDGVIGEVWVAGPSVAAGYWNRPQENFAAFGARLPDSERPYLRTGDLGFLHNGSLFVTGRLKDVIIIRGRNLYPQDIEQTVRDANAAVDSGAAFAVVEGAEDRLVVVHQVGREHRRGDLTPVLKAVRAAVVDEYELDPHAIVLLRPGGLPLTTSGKVQRNRCREMFEAGELPSLAEWRRPSVAEAGAEQSAGDVQQRPAFLDELDKLTRDELAAEISTWLLGWIRNHVGEDAGDLDANATFPELGVDSLTALELSAAFEDVLGVQLSPIEAFEHPTPAALSKHLAQQMQASSLQSAG